MTDQKNPLISMAVNFITNPWVMAGLGGAAGYYFFGREDGKTKEGKTPYVAAGVGAAAGLAAGKLIQHMRMQQALQAPQQAPQIDQTQQQSAQQQSSQQDQSAQGDYYSMGTVPDVDEVFGQQSAPQAQYQQPQEEMPLQADLEEPMGLGSLDGTSLGSAGLGSFNREDGFDAYDDAIDEAIDDASSKRRMN